LLDASAGDASTRRLGSVRFNPVYRAFRGLGEDRGASSSAASTGLRPVIVRIPAAGLSSPFDEQCTLAFKDWPLELPKLRDDLFVVLEPLDPREPAYVFHDLARRRGSVSRRDAVFRSPTVQPADQSGVRRWHAPAAVARRR
jgi:hypothetical protein